VKRVAKIGAVVVEAEKAEVAEEDYEQFAEVSTRAATAAIKEDESEVEVARPLTSEAVKQPRSERAAQVPQPKETASKKGGVRAEQHVQKAVAPRTIRFVAKPAAVPGKVLRDLDRRPAWPPTNVSCLLSINADVAVPKSIMRGKAYPIKGTGRAGPQSRQQESRRPQPQEQELTIHRLADDQNRGWVQRLEEEQTREEHRSATLRAAGDEGDKATLESTFAIERRVAADELRRVEAHNELEMAAAMEDAGMLAVGPQRSWQAKAVSR
jgi:hypothetical protein